MEEEIKKRIIGNVVSRVIAKNMHICIYTNLYFLSVKMAKSSHNIRNGGLND
jgi:hypothetical protein